MAIESPAFTVERKDNNFEIRRYSKYILAQVDVESDFDDALRKGFEILAHYIFGGNKKRQQIPMTAPVSEESVSSPEKIPMIAPVTAEKIPMTAPVIEEQTGEHVYRISFAMPSKYSLETLPAPEDKRITFKVVESRRTATIRFSGRINESLANKKIEELKTWLSGNNITKKSNFDVALYNPPFIPGIFRRNEIIVDI